MNHFRMELEWEAPEGARGEELRATWAYLKILAGDSVVTRVNSHASQGVREGIFVPLYPLAEWIVRNWWALLNEVPSPRSSMLNGYHRRHNIRFASEGFALPDLWLRPEGSRFLLQWRPAQRVASRVTFLEQGSMAFSREEVEECLRGLVNSVVARLDDHGIRGTFLAQEWDAINEADAEEASYCRAVGRLGEDPYAENPEDLVDVLIDAESQLSRQAFEEILSAVAWSDLKAAGTELIAFAHRAEQCCLDLQPLLDLRNDMKQGQIEIDNGGVPWQQGYEFAVALRQRLGLSPSDVLPKVPGIGDLFGVRAEEWSKCISEGFSGIESVSAAVAPTKDQFPCFGLSGHFESNRVFALCRGLFEYFAPPLAMVGIATYAYSERQKRNRAFAAEFIAPAKGIAECLSKVKVLSEESIFGIAERFGTSEYVIRHQIQNNRLATIEDAAQVGC